METFQSKVRKIQRLLYNNRIKKINLELNLCKTDMQQIKVKLGFVLGTYFVRYSYAVPFCYWPFSTPKNFKFTCCLGKFYLWIAINFPKPAVFITPCLSWLYNGGEFFRLILSVQSVCGNSRNLLWSKLLIFAIVFTPSLLCKYWCSYERKA